jgi:ribosomal protein L10
MQGVISASGKFSRPDPSGPERIKMSHSFKIHEFKEELFGGSEVRVLRISGLELVIDAYGEDAQIEARDVLEAANSVLDKLGGSPILCLTDEDSPAPAEYIIDNP